MGSPATCPLFILLAFGVQAGFRLILRRCFHSVTDLLQHNEATRQIPPASHFTREHYLRQDLLVNINKPYTDWSGCFSPATPLAKTNPDELCR